MKFLAVFLLAILAAGSVRGDSEECSEEKADACFDVLMSDAFDDASEEERCKEFRKSVDCMRDLVANCLGDDDIEEIEEGLKKMEKMLERDCGANSDDSITDSQCFNENVDYLHGCVDEMTQQAVTTLLTGTQDENTIKCVMFGMVVHCVLERLGEKCGEEAVEKAREELTEDDIPDEVKEACEAAEDLHNYFEDVSVNLLDKKRRK